jgi:hypothetical protein
LALAYIAAIVGSRFRMLYFASSGDSLALHLAEEYGAYIHYILGALTAAFWSAGSILGMHIPAAFLGFELGEWEHGDPPLREVLEFAAGMAVALVAMRLVARRRQSGSPPDAQL